MDDVKESAGPVVTLNRKARLAEKAAKRRKGYKGQTVVVLAPEGDDLTRDTSSRTFTGMNPGAGGNHGGR